MAGADDPVFFHAKFQTRTVGTAKIVKQSDDGIIGGISFVVNGNGINRTVTTQNDGTISTNLPPGQYTITETLLDRYLPVSSQTVTVTSGQTSTVNFSNIIKKGRILIVKHTDDGSTGIETPETGATFHVYPSTAAGYNSAPENKRDILVVDTDGFARSNKDLPYGVYKIEQINGWPGRELMDPFTVFISQHNKTYTFIINNRAITSKVMIVKKDAETGQVITKSGVGFQVFDVQADEFICQRLTYPEPTDIDVFYTSENGRLMLPEPLISQRDYLLYEVESPYGYVLSTDPVPFRITGDEEIVTVEMMNVSQKGTITIEKQADTLVSVIQEDGLYSPIFDMDVAESAKFDVICEKDIFTGDGTLRASAGEVVDTIEIIDGVGMSKQLYLGQYRLVETQIPEGMVKAEDVLVELTYAGQTIEVTDISTTILNQKQQVNIILRKWMELDEHFDIGNNDEILEVVFGLYSAEQITAMDGSIIPADGLIACTSPDESGQAVFQADLPYGKEYYVQEISSNEKYRISDTKYPITFTSDNNKMSLVEIQIYNGEDIPNHIVRGDVKGLKTDTEGSPLQGAVFGLFWQHTTDFSEQDALMLATSDEQGVFAFYDIPYGSYIIVEIQSPEGYRLSDEVYGINITEHGMAIDLTAINEQIQPPPKTGDESDLSLIWIAMLSSLIGILVCAIRVWKSKGKEEEQ
ncbi:hypothetical protein LJC55_03710 [Eubacteriales bacterium OttesenSCG-928-N14]|nr:hypothetical protein [Eubacteriales bacterium OttesenSCG-928-N14]